MIVKFLDYINEEVSKNDPIPEINRISKGLGIILLGTPGAGKSTFINNFILTKNHNFKTFSTDDISLRYTKDPQKYYRGSSELNIKRLNKYMETNGGNFIYDTTGTKESNITEVSKLAKSFGYTLIFALILVDIETTKKQNIERGLKGGHKVPDDFIEYVYDKQFKNIGRYSAVLKPDSFYIIHNNNKKYKFYKFKDGQIFKRSVDKYVPVVRNK